MENLYKKIDQFQTLIIIYRCAFIILSCPDGQNVPILYLAFKTLYLIFNYGKLDNIFDILGLALYEH